MKTLKQLSLRVLPLFLLFAFAACSGDDSKETKKDFSSDKFVGKWKLVGFETNPENYIAINDSRTVYEIDGDGGGKYHASETSTFDLTWENLGGSLYHVEHYGTDWTLEIEFQDNDSVIRIEDEDSASYYKRK